MRRKLTIPHFLGGEGAGGGEGYRPGMARHSIVRHDSGLA
jgi:hypothetical protein